MAKARRIPKTWSTKEEKLMSKLVRQGEPTARIARKLHRTPAAIRSKAQKQNLSLKHASR